MTTNKPLTQSSLRYTWRQLAARAIGADYGAGEMEFEALGLKLYYADPSQINPSSQSIVVIPCNPTDWSDLSKRPPETVHWLSASEVLPPNSESPLDDFIAVPFWGSGYQDGNKPFAEMRSDEVVVFYADIIATALFMLSRWEETILPDRDEYRRFPATASVAYKQGFLDRPIVDEYALILREWLKVLLPRWEPEPLSFSVKLSHDIDTIRRFQSIPAAARSLGGDLVRRRDPMRALDTVRDAVAQVIAPARTDDVLGIYHLADLSSAYGLENDAFYFMADGPGPFGCGYDPTSPAVRKCINDLRKQGFEVGFHPGYHTFQNPDRLAEEKARMDPILDETRYGGRQHFLRFQAPDTWRHWEQVGLTYDSTLTYADHEGFRCGTCRPFRPFDLEQNRELSLWEVPLIMMDGTLCNYRNLTPSEGKRRILELAHRCKRVGGTFTLLWHNSSLKGEWRPWAKVYQEIVAQLADLQTQNTINSL